jgi:hypothetical protein
MIFYVSTRKHSNTQVRLHELVPSIKHLSYFRLFARRRLPIATYVFTDLDRLSFWHLELAAHYRNVLIAAGARVLNDPARFLQRLALLRQLQRAGINDFHAWPAYDAALVDRFPVLLRTERAHRGVRIGPIRDGEALRVAIDKTMAQGFPLTDLMIVEFAAEPVREGFYRKPAIYRVGEQLIASPSVHQSHWLVKEGRSDLAGEADYADDLDRVRDNPYGAAARQVFDLAHVEFGRTDIGVIAGRPQFYEINTNPYTPQEYLSHHSPLRREAFRLFEERLGDALRTIDAPLSGTAKIPPPGTTRCDRYFALGLAQFFIP